MKDAIFDVGFLLFCYDLDEYQKVQLVVNLLRVDGKIFKGKQHAA